MYFLRVVRALLLKIIFKSYLRRKIYALEKLKGKKPKYSISDRFINLLLKYLFVIVFILLKTPLNNLLLV